MVVVFVFMTLVNLNLAIPRKDCTLVRSRTNTGQCFNEPECNEECQTVNEQECSMVNKEKCSMTYEQQCSTVPER